MFSDKKKPAIIPSQITDRNIIGKGTSITGDLVSEGDFRIDGTVEGTIKTSGRVVIGKEGKVSGTVECNFADIEGDFIGKIIVNQLLTLKATSTITGETIIGTLAVEPGATFVNTTCTMKGTVKELNKNGQSKQTKKTA
ncbi:MAG: polymer-forming cytoskeletal protein [Flavobacteriales bacterium]|jgi:cytoskeletal protein CcmA (bactofilin family)|nr:polymer-forming cytoskeletal protein [Flavobacteriales bacterium]